MSQAGCSPPPTSLMPASANSLYTLDVSDGVVLRIDPARLNIQATSPPLPLLTTHLAIDPTGRWLIAAGSATPPSSSNRAGHPWIVVLDPVSFTPIGNLIDLATNVSDIEAFADGRAPECCYDEYEKLRPRDRPGDGPGRRGAADDAAR